MLKNILENVLSSGSNGADDKIKELINNIIGENQVPFSPLQNIWVKCKCQYKNVQKWQNKNVQLFKTKMIF